MKKTSNIVQFKGYKRFIEIDLNKYKKFVQAVTSEESNDTEMMILRIRELESKVNVSLLLTGAIGLSAEAGEFMEIVKKAIFQGKPMNDENIFHIKRELGDIIWYWVNSCRALGLDPNDVIVENVRKLESRYPGGSFNAHYSENRKEGDL
jgi:NTP pyrophosphatase (non-canonical NTP hydrolase)